MSGRRVPNWLYCPWLGVMVFTLLRAIYRYHTGDIVDAFFMLGVLMVLLLLGPAVRVMEGR